MRASSAISAGLNLAVLAGVILAAVVVPETPREDKTLVDRTVRKFNAMRRISGGREEETEGYYEDLFQSSRRSVAISAVVSGQWAAKWTTWEFKQVQESTMKRRSDFLYFELLPHLDVREVDGRLVTNSFGMADREYPTTRQAGFRRCAFIGDSMTRGLGSSPGANYESLLEDSLTAMGPNPEYQGYEFLNFGVEAYRLTQMVEVVRTKAAEFSPDCYIVVLSDLSVARKWADHIWQLVNDGIDLQYDFLKDVVKRAGLRAGDDAVALESRLAPYRPEILRWALGSIQAMAARQNAEVVVILVPNVSDEVALAESFRGMSDLTRSLGLATVDLLDTFAGIQNLTPYKVPRSGDSHPSDKGHRLLFERLLSRIQANPQAWQVFTGVREANGSGPGF